MRTACASRTAPRVSTGTETRARPARQTLSAPAGRRRRARAPRTTGPRSPAAPGRASYAPVKEPRTRPRRFPVPAPARMTMTVCVDATSCTANHYLSGGECVACADGSTSTDATSTTCECGAAQYFADGSCNACPSTSTCASPPCSAVTECECPADHYVEWKSNNWVCTECKSGQTKTATAIPADKSSEETASACSAATTCATTTITWPRMMIRA